MEIPIRITKNINMSVPTTGKADDRDNSLDTEHGGAKRAKVLEDGKEEKFLLLNRASSSSGKLATAFAASEASQNPTKVEREFRDAAGERERAHIDRNAERREKKDRTLFDDNSNKAEATIARHKIEHQNRLTGCAVMISHGISVVVVEGCHKSIKTYDQLMLRRIDWAASIKNKDDEDGHSPANKCTLGWQGYVAKTKF
ncbi:OLC1v1013227C1 [Oldenlandia corymbosa var. corymbosa]|uniref:OLC1v1013227C1 n=1 Tax=Oldenlandia corymbosa var. corymbosa TaxID=529605 RepID=A0AAV1DXX7_OLDCO|nr:OLC1v1013227C1 [Oldenlandia corymbosa var. corymbosa]